MYILYLDDSGSVANQNEHYFVLGGVAVPEQSIRWLSHQLEQLASVRAPENPWTVEFHASEIFSGRKSVWSSLKREERIQVLKDVLRCLDQAYPEIVTFACAVHKSSYPQQDCVELAFEEISSRFDLFLSRQQDSSSGAGKGVPGKGLKNLYY